MDSQCLSARRASPLSPPPPCAHLSASVFIPSLARPVALLSFAVAVAASDFFPGRSSDPPSVVAFTHPLPSSRPFPPSLPPFPAVLLSFRRYSSAVALAVFVFFLSPAGSLGEIRTRKDRCRTPKSRTNFRPIHFRVMVHERITLTLLSLKSNGP